MPRKEILKAADVAEALTKTRGVIAHAARVLGCDWHTVERYINEYVTVKAAYDVANETNLDVAEDGLAAFVRGQVEENGKLRFVDDKTRLDAIKYYLSRKGKHRGYTEKTEHDLTSKGQSITRMVIVDEAGDRTED